MNFNHKKVLVIDDDINLANMIKVIFEAEGAIVYMAHNGRDGLQQFFQQRPDVVILDVVMPEMNGWETCQQIRLLADTPILMLTTMNEDQDIVRGLEYGADDYISKPFSPDVLKARVTAVLRRVKIDTSPEAGGDQFQDEHLTIDLTQRHVSANGELVKLSATEFKLLSYLLQNANRVLSYQQILINVWGPEYRDNIDYVHVYISHLRRKLEPDARNPRYFQNEHGFGYRFLS